MRNLPTGLHWDHRAHRLALALATPVLAFTPTAQAYIDPGTGSLILQGLIAALAGIAVTAGIYWDRVKAFFRRHRDAPERGSDRDGPAGAAGRSNRTPDDD